MKTIVITVRGTRSLEDLVVDLQFTPESLEKVDRICGFDGAGHWCHKGFLARSNWIYNDIKRTNVLNTLYLETSPYNTYPLVLCGHSLGAGASFCNSSSKHCLIYVTNIRPPAFDYNVPCLPVGLK